MSYTYDEEKDYQKVTSMMLNLGFQPKMVGFDYIRSAVLYFLKRDEDDIGITKDVYPFLAKQYNTKESSVERSIRISIDNAYKSGGLLGINDYYDAIVYTNKFKLSNNELIALLAEIIKLDDLRKGIYKKLKASQSHR